MTPAEQAVFFAAIEDVRAGRAYALAQQAEREARIESLDHMCAVRIFRALAEITNCQSTIKLCNAVDALDREQAAKP